MNKTGQQSGTGKGQGNWYTETMEKEIAVLVVKPGGCAQRITFLAEKLGGCA